MTKQSQKTARDKVKAILKNVNNRQDKLEYGDFVTESASCQGYYEIKSLEYAANTGIKIKRCGK